MSDEQLPHVSLRDPAHLVDRRARWLWTAEAVVPALGLAAVGVAITLFGWVHLPWWLWTAYAALAAAYAVVMPTIRYRVHRWETTDTAVYTQTGWLSRERRIAPMSRVQTVEFHQGPISRLCKLGSVTVTTASAAGPLRIDGLDVEVARRLVENLTLRAEVETGDAT